MMGTFLYSAPEVMREATEATAAADVYSLAMTAAFCLSGADLPIEVLLATEEFLRELPCSSRIRATLKKAMARQPEKRFSSVAAFGAALELAAQSSKEEDYSQYEDFFVRIWPDPSGYATIASSRFGDVSAPFEIPFSENVTGKLAQREAVEGLSARAVGQALFAALFAGNIGVTFRQCLADRHPGSNSGLRILLEFDFRNPHVLPVAALPWELLWDAERSNFLSLSRQTPIIRFLPLPLPPLPPLAGPLRILFVQASPSDGQAFSAAWAAIWKAFRPQPEMMVATLLQPTITMLRHKLLEESWNVIHLMGHGGFDEETGEGSLYFETSDGAAESISGRLLGEHLKSFPDLRLIFLNTSKGAVVPRMAGQYPCAGIATDLVQAGIPAVIAMRGPISHSESLAFSANVYSRIAAGEPVDAAVVEGRLALLRERSSAWALPVLFSRLKDGNILGLSGE